MPISLLPNATIQFNNIWTFQGASSFHEAVRSNDDDLSWIEGDLQGRGTAIEFGLDDVAASLPDYNYQYIDVAVRARSLIQLPPQQQKPLLIVRVLGHPDDPDADDDPTSPLRNSFTLTPEWQTFTKRIDLSSVTKSQLNALRLQFETGLSLHDQDRARISFGSVEFFDPALSRTAKLRWRWRDPVTRTSKIRWAIPLSPASRTIRVRWNVTGPAAKLAKIRWGVRTVAAHATKVRWAIREVAAHTAKVRYKVEPCSFKIVKLRWHCGGTVAHVAKIRWSILTGVSATSKIRWRITTLAEHVAKVRWIVKQLAVKRTKVRWNVTKPNATLTDFLVLDTSCDDDSDLLCHPFVVLQVKGKFIEQVSVNLDAHGYGAWQYPKNGLVDVTLPAGEGDHEICLKARNVINVETPEICKTVELNLGEPLEKLHNNLPALYSRDKSGLLYDLLSAWSLWLCHASRSIDSAIDQANVNLASGRWLDYWGQLTGFGRKVGESDADYRVRIVTWLTTDKVTLLGVHQLTQTEVGTGTVRFREFALWPGFLLGDLSGAHDFDFERLKVATDLARPAGVKVLWKGGDYKIELVPIDDHLDEGDDEASYRVIVTSIGGFFGPVELVAGDLPAGYVASFSTPTVTVPPGGSVEATMFIFRETGLANFLIEVMPALGELDAAPAVFTVRVVSVSGFSGTVALSDADVPFGYDGDFVPSSVSVPANGYAESTLTVSRA